MEHVHPSHGNNAWVPAVVGWAFLSTGLLMLLAVAYNLAATSSPETILDVSSTPIARGDTLTVHLSQPGPVRLKSLRANFAGEELYVPIYGRSPGETGTTVDRRHLGTFPLFRQDNVDVRSGRTFETTATFVIPLEIQPSGRIGHKTTTWRVEVWGSVRHGFNFRHPFVIDVI